MSLIYTFYHDHAYKNITQITGVCYLKFCKEHVDRKTWFKFRNQYKSAKTYLQTDMRAANQTAK